MEVKYLMFNCYWKYWLIICGIDSLIKCIYLFKYLCVIVCLVSVYVFKI